MANESDKSLVPHSTDGDAHGFSLERLAILEEIVGLLALKAGAHLPHVERWLMFVKDWPDNPNKSSLSQEAKYLLDELRLSLPTRA